MRISTIDKWIEELESAEKVDKTSEYHKNMAIAYLKNYLGPEAATSKDAP